MDTSKEDTFDADFDKKFGFARELAQVNADADAKTTESLNVSDQAGVKTEIPTQPELEESANLEQVDAVSTFAVADVTEPTSEEVADVTEPTSEEVAAA